MCGRWPLIGMSARGSRHVRMTLAGSAQATPLMLRNKAEHVVPERGKTQEGRISSSPSSTKARCSGRLIVTLHEPHKPILHPTDNVRTSCAHDVGPHHPRGPGVQGWSPRAIAARDPGRVNRGWAEPAARRDDEDGPA